MSPRTRPHLREDAWLAKEEPHASGCQRRGFEVIGIHWDSCAPIHRVVNVASWNTAQALNAAGVNTSIGSPSCRRAGHRKLAAKGHSGRL